MNSNASLIQTRPKETLGFPLHWHRIEPEYIFDTTRACILYHSPVYHKLLSTSVEKPTKDSS